MGLRKMFKDKDNESLAILGVGGTTSAVLAGLAVKWGLQMNPIIKDTLQWGGASLLAAGATSVVLDRRKNQENRGIGGGGVTAMVGGVALFSSFFIGRHSSIEGGDPPPPTTTVVAGTQAEQPLGEPSQTTIEVDSGGHCAIMAPIEGDSEEAQNSVELLEGYLHNTVSPSTGQPYLQEEPDNRADAATGKAVDQLQIDLGLDPAPRWDELTCSKIPGFWQLN